MNRRQVWRRLFWGSCVAAVVSALFLQAPIPQDPGYHAMADQRTLWGIPNCLNVISNLPFLAVGLWGLRVTWRHLFAHEWERWPYAALFAGTALTAFGSGWYHLAPDNERLVWDRLPMTAGFMGLLTAMIAERVSVRASRKLLIPLLLAGAASVAFWHWSEGRGQGDLRPYLLVQFGSLAGVVALVVGRPPKYPGSAYLTAALLVYAVAKALELADSAVFRMGGVVSGHTLKHLAAAGSVGFVTAMFTARRGGSLV